MQHSHRCVAVRQLLPNRSYQILVWICILPYFSRPRGDWPRRSLTSLSATAQSVCYHPLNDTFCLWWVWFLYWNQYAQRFVSFILFLHIQARQTVALWWKSCFVLFFVGTNKYNLCQGCLRGSMWVTFAISARLVHRTLGLWRQTTPPISFWWCSLLDDR